MEKSLKSSSRPSRFSTLSEESSQIFESFSEILSEISTRRSVSILTTAQKLFFQLQESYSGLSKGIQQKIQSLRVKSSDLSSKCKKIRHSSSRMLSLQKAKMVRKEKVINKTQESISESLGLIKNLWLDNLKTMKKGLRRGTQLKENIQLQVKKFDEEMNSEVAGKTIEKDLISHQSAFEIQESCPNLSVITDKSVHRSNSSLEFEQCMAELDMFRQQPSNGNISIEKSFGGWKSEYDSETESFISNPNEIKNAIQILKKANLLNSKGGNLLDKLTNLMKSPGNTQKIELLLQLHDLQNKSKPISTKNSQKPPLKIPRLKRGEEIVDLGEMAATPKAAFVYNEDLDLAKTILSSENPLSARQADENLENILEELRKDEFKRMNESNQLNDVQLEDLLKIPFIFPELKTASGVISNPVEERQGGEERPDYLSCLSVLSPSEAKIPSPAKKQLSGFDYQSTGISSQSGLRSRITLKTGGSEASQKVFTPGSKGVEESFKYIY
jgi:hypothetical protein